MSACVVTYTGAAFNQALAQAHPRKMHHSTSLTPVTPCTYQALPVSHVQQFSLPLVHQAHSTEHWNHSDWDVQWLVVLTCSSCHLGVAILPQMHYLFHTLSQWWGPHVEEHSLYQIQPASRLLLGDHHYDDWSHLRCR